MIYLVTADYRDPPVAPPYGVEADSAQEAKSWFQRTFSHLRVYDVRPLLSNNKPPALTMRKADEPRRAIGLIKDAHEGMKLGGDCASERISDLRNQIVMIFRELDTLAQMIDTLENDLYVNRRYVDGRLIDFLDKLGGMKNANT